MYTSCQCSMLHFLADFFVSLISLIVRSILNPNDYNDTSTVPREMKKRATFEIPTVINGQINSFQENEKKVK